MTVPTTSSMQANHDIVITGLGLVSAMGLSPMQTWSGMLNGRSCIGTMSALEQQPADGGSHGLGAQAPDLPDDFYPNWSRAARYLRFAIDHAMHEAFERGLP